MMNQLQEFWVNLHNLKQQLGNNRKHLLQVNQGYSAFPFCQNIACTKTDIILLCRQTAVLLGVCLEEALHRCRSCWLISFLKVWEHSKTKKMEQWRTSSLSLSVWFDVCVMIAPWRWNLHHFWPKGRICPEPCVVWEWIFSWLGTFWDPNSGCM